jgi:hypothetical protein
MVGPDLRVYNVLLLSAHVAERLIVLQDFKLVEVHTTSFGAAGKLLMVSGLQGQMALGEEGGSGNDSAAP